MKTNNKIANHIISRGVAKWLQRTEAGAIWNDLKAEGWRAEGLTLVKLDGDTYHHFQFEKHGSRIAVSHNVMEVAQ